MLHAYAYASHTQASVRIGSWRRLAQMLEYINTKLVCVRANFLKLMDGFYASQDVGKIDVRLSRLVT